MANGVYDLLRLASIEVLDVLDLVHASAPTRRNRWSNKNVNTSGIGYNTIDSIVVPEGEAHGVLSVIIGKKSDESKAACLVVAGAARRVASANVVLVGSQLLATVRDDAVWSAQVLVDTATQQMRVQVQGNTGDSVTWVAHSTFIKSDS